jgi:predicted short-subunit dehydrogenase-like oxidoreductase (DUF2520 family)
MKLNIIGLGRLSKTLAKLFLSHQLLEIQAIHSTTRKNVLTFLDEVRQGEIYDDVLDLPRAPLTMITTPDDQIEKISDKLVLHSSIQPGDIFFHCSGLLSSNVLAALRSKGAQVASVHPLKSFTHYSQENYTGTYCAIEGDEDAVRFLEAIFKKIGFIPFALNPAQKTLYHCGAVIASNYLVTLFEEANRCFEAAGVASEIRKAFIISLMQSTLGNLQKEDSRMALTGPLARGDIGTISTHLDMLAHQSAVYRVLGKATLPLTSHDKQLIDELSRLLDQN